MEEKNAKSRKKFEPIAVVGVGALYPGSKHAEGFWQTIVDGSDLVTEVPEDHWLIDDYYDPDPKAVDKTYCKRGAFLDHYAFDPMEYGIPPQTIPSLDTSQLLALVVAKEVLGELDDEKFRKTDLSRISVILGAATLEAIQYVSSRMQRPVWEKSLTEYGLAKDQVGQICDRISEHYTPWQESTFPGLLSNVVAGRIANRFNLGGSNCIVDAACAGSLAALSMSLSELQMGTADMVITGGVDTLNDIVMFMCFSKTPALSMTGDCRPFSAAADGTILGEGIGMLALKRLSDAERDGNKIYGLIRGMGTSSDGRSKSIYAPLSAGQSKAILRAYDQAEFDLKTVELIEAHGTGTRAGDLAEINGLNMAFSVAGATEPHTCALGSIKSQIGHTKSASGAAGLFKALMSLRHKVLPPTLKVDAPNPQFSWETSPFYLNTNARPWVRNNDHPRRAGVSSFGFGGSNYHVALEEYQGNAKAPRLRTTETELIVIGAGSPQALLKTCEQTLNTISTNTLAYLAHQSQHQFDAAFLSRVAIVATSIDDLRQKLTEVMAAIKQAPEDPIVWAKGIYYAHADNPGKVAFLFPGQGSQYLNMGADLAMAFDQAMLPWERAATAFDKQYLHDIVFALPGFAPDGQQKIEQQLTATEWAQPALAVTSLAQLNILQALQVYPDCVAGHSFGEVTALHAAAVFDDAALLTIARKRGELMKAAASEPGAMLSVLHPKEAVLSLLKKWKLDITPANYNSPKQIVLSGSVIAIEAAEDLLKKESISYRRLPVMTGFHSPLVAPACKPFAACLKSIDFKTPTVPVYANTTASVYPGAVSEMKQLLANQLANPVQFEQQIKKMYQAGVRTFIEVGPQGILTSLVRQCLLEKPHRAIQCDRKGQHGVTQLWHALGQLVVAGLTPQFRALWVEYQVPVQAKPTENKFTLMLNGTNYGKPYPSATPLPPIKHKIQSNSQEIIYVSEKTPSSMNTHHDLQKQLVDAHNTYQKAMAESHIAFLNSVTQLAGYVSGTGVQITSAPAAIAPPVAVQAPAQPVQTPPMAAAPARPAAPRFQEPAKPPVAPALVAVPIVAPSPVDVKASPAPASGQHTDLKQLLLEVVAEKTGYPTEMLNMNMAIEADLGIDSIKRVEILSALSGQLPALPEIAPNEIAQLSTLSDIVAHMESQLGLSSATGKEAAR